MAPPPLVSIDDFESWIGSSVDSDRATAVLSRVSALIRSETRLTWLEDDGVTLSTVPEEVASITLQVATRVWMNPNGLKQESVADYSVTYGQTSGLFLLPEERALLARYRTNARGLWSLSTTREDPYADSAWVPIEGTTAQFPWYADDIVT